MASWRPGGELSLVREGGLEGTACGFSSVSVLKQRGLNWFEQMVRIKKDAQDRDRKSVV